MGLKIGKPVPRQSDSGKRFTLRMDTQLFENIANIAAVHRRSTAKEIEIAIEHYVEWVYENEREEE